MTLSTRILVMDHVDVHEMFREGQRLLSLFDEDHRDPSQHDWTDVPLAERPGSPWRIGNELGQGLPAILDITYRPGEGGMLRTEARAAEHDEDCEADCDGQWHPRACWSKIELDTAYSYKNELGWGCAALHAALIAGFGLWLEQRGARLRWVDEFTDEVHDGAHGLAEFASEGRQPSEWFATDVLPDITGTPALAGQVSQG